MILVSGLEANPGEHGKGSSMNALANDATIAQEIVNDANIEYS